MGQNTRHSIWLQQGRSFPLYHHCQTGSGAHPVLCPVHTAAIFPQQ